VTISFPRRTLLHGVVIAPVFKFVNVNRARNLLDEILYEADKEKTQTILELALASEFLLATSWINPAGIQSGTWRLTSSHLNVELH
jgi:hypothetical protein